MGKEEIAKKFLNSSGSTSPTDSTATLLVNNSGRKQIDESRHMSGLLNLP